jgi:Domain of unknown function (DUF4333)
MSSLRRPVVLVIALAALLALGCGETVIDDVKTEDAIQHNLEKEVGRQIESVDCPEDVEVEPKTTFECEVAVAKGPTEIATLRIINEDADVELVRLSPDQDPSR